MQMNINARTNVKHSCRLLGLALCFPKLYKLMVSITEKNTQKRLLYSFLEI